MRAADAIKHWRHIYQKSYNLSFNQITFADIPAIGRGEISFLGGITAICGGNGAGKTTLIEAISGIFGADRVASSSISKAKLGNAILSANITQNKLSTEILSMFDSDSWSSSNRENFNITCIDPATQSSSIVSMFAKMTNFEELLESISPRLLDKKELRLLSYIVGKDYSSCEIFEIDDFAEDGSVIPYFRVTSNGKSYGLETMGLGEVSLHLMFWYLSRISASSILLIEEPETHISIRSQKALLNVIAKISNEKSIWVIMTTHSPVIIGLIPTEHIRIMYRQDNGVGIIHTPTISQLQSILGITAHNYSGIILVEDQAAKEFTTAWIRHFNPTIMENFEILASINGSGDIINAIRSFPKTSQWFKLIGLFDGDMRDNIALSTLPHAFLPGNLAPEELLIPMAKQNTYIFASQLNINIELVNLVFSEIEGLDHHDWYEELAKKLHISHPKIMAALFHTWIQDTANAEAAENSYKKLLELLF